MLIRLLSTSARNLGTLLDIFGTFSRKVSGINIKKMKKKSIILNRFTVTCNITVLHTGTPASNLGYLAPPPPPPPAQENFSWVPNCSLGPPGWETKVSSKKIWFGLCESAWFLCQPIANLRRGSAYKITHISAVTYPRLLNLIPY